MPMIPAKDSSLIREHLARQLSGPVRIDFFTQKESSLSLPLQECVLCRETEDLLRELSGLSNRIDLEVHDFIADEQTARNMGITRIPAFVLSGASRGKVRFFGIPSGYEFSTLLEDLIDVSRGTTDLAQPARQELESLGRDVHIQVFTTPT
jgi:alkyl hydroperoxide reductase subunit AhpF